LDNPPAFQFFPRDWLTSRAITSMTPAQRGYYIHLLAHAWLSEFPGHIPNDPSIIWKLAGAESREIFDRDGGLVLSQFSPARGGKTLANARLVKCMQVMVLARRERIRAGHAGASSRWVNKINGSAMRLPMAKNGSSSSTASSTATATATASALQTPLPSSVDCQAAEFKPTENPKNNPAPSAHPVKENSDLPVWLPEATWIAFAAHRKSLRAPLTKHASDLIFKKLDAFRQSGADPQKVLEQSIENGWRGIFQISRGKNGNETPEDRLRRAVQNSGLDPQGITKTGRVM
jgi:hypothetical protein